MVVAEFLVVLWLYFGCTFFSTLPGPKSQTSFSTLYAQVRVVWQHPSIINFDTHRPAGWANSSSSDHSNASSPVAFELADGGVGDIQGTSPLGALADAVFHGPVSPAAAAAVGNALESATLAFQVALNLGTGA